MIETVELKLTSELLYLSFNLVKYTSTRQNLYLFDKFFWHYKVNDDKYMG